MQALLAQVYWIGESPCSGKSTIAARLAAALPQCAVVHHALAQEE